MSAENLMLILGYIFFTKCHVFGTCLPNAVAKKDKKLFAKAALLWQQKCR
jgi:hypothetical protein